MRATLSIHSPPLRALVAALVLAACASVPDALASRDAAYAAVHARLSLMTDVAAWKHANAAPVEDAEREAVVLAQAVDDAAAAGLAPETVAPFFRAQIEAAKDIQSCWIARWEAGAAAPANPPDLAGDIRPELTRLGAAIVAELSGALQAGAAFSADSPGALAATEVECLGEERRAALHEALAEVRAASH